LSDSQTRKKDSLIDRLFLFGIRPLLIVIAVFALGAYMVISGLLSANVGYMFTGVILVLLSIGLGYGFKTTGTKKITKTYFTKDVKAGRVGRAKKTFGRTVRGVVELDNEYWTAISDEEISEGDDVTVLSVEPDKVTLRVEKKKN
jgi:membrane protein implicated in regulation of membrane protease activity